MAIYFKDKTETLKAKITKEQELFIGRLALHWGVSRSEVIRIILDTYRKGVSNEDK